MWCSHLKTLLTPAVSHTLNINMVAESKGLSSLKKCQMLAVSGCCRYPSFCSAERQQKGTHSAYCLAFPLGFYMICH